MYYIEVLGYFLFRNLWVLYADRSAKNILLYNILTLILTPNFFVIMIHILLNSFLDSRENYAYKNL